MCLLLLLLPLVCHYLHNPPPELAYYTRFFMCLILLLRIGYIATTRFSCQLYFPVWMLRTCVLIPASRWTPTCLVPPQQMVIQATSDARYSRSHFQAGQLLKHAMSSEKVGND